jgi:hypothetical protein
MKERSCLADACPCDGGYGSRYAIGFNPQGWQTSAGQTYSVSVTGIATPINYEVTVVDCGS